MAEGVTVSSLRSVLTLDDSRFKQGIAESVAAMKAATTETQKMAAGLAAHLKVEAEATASAARSATVKRQEIALDRELTAARAKLSEMLAGEDKLVAQVGARYSGLSNARRAELVEVKQQIAAQDALTAATKRQIDAEISADAAYTRFQAKKLADAQKNAGKNLSTIGQGLTSAVSVPLLGLGAAAAASGYDVQGAEAEIRTRTGAQGSQLAGLDESLKKVAVSVPQSMKTVGEAIGDVAARTGLTGKALEDLTKTELDFARITDSQVAPLIQATTQLFTAWGISARDQIPVLDLLNRAHEKTGVSAQKLAEELTRFSPVFHTMNLGIVDSIALLASFEKAGIPPTTIMRGLTQEMSKLAKAGVTDAHRAFQIIVQDIEHAKTPMDALKEATRLFGARVGNDLVQDIRSGKLSLEGLEKALTDGNDTISKAAAQTRTFGVVFGEFRNQVEVALAPLGLILLKTAAQILDALKPLLDTVKDGIDWFSQLGTGAQEAILGIAAAAILLGPAIVKMGAFVTMIIEMKKAALELSLVTQVVSGTSGAGVVGGLVKMGVGAVALGALWVGVFAAMGLAAWGLATNFHHVRDELISDARIVGGTTEKLPGKIFDLFKPGAKRIGVAGALQKATSEAVSDEFKLNEELGPSYFNPPGAAKQKGTAESALDKTLADWKATLARLNSLTSKGGGTGESDADIRARIAKAGAGNEKLTPAQQESKSLDAALGAERERHGQLLAGEGNIAAQVAARFHLLHDARVQELIDLTTADKALEKKNSANQRAVQTTEQLRAKIAEMNAQIRGEPKSAAQQVAAQFAGADPDVRNAAVAAAQQEADVAARLHAVQGLRQQIAAVEQQTRVGRGEDKSAPSTDPIQVALTQRLDAEKQTYAAEKAARDAATAAAKADTKAQEDLLHRLTEGAKEVGTEHAKLTGTSKTLTEAQTLLNDAYNSGNPLLILWAQALEDATQANEKLSQSQKDAGKAFDAEVKIWDKAGSLAEEQAKRHTELMNTSKGVTEAQVLLNAAIQDGDIELALYLDQIIKNTKANDAFAKNVAQQKRLIESVASGTAGVVANSLQNIWQHGFKGFFANVIDGFKQMFQQIALDIIRSEIQRKITDALTPKAPGSSGGSSSSAGLIGDLIGLGVSSLGGGGAAAAGGSYDNSYGAHFASGGDVYAGVPITVGENGSETFVPRTTGTILPHGATTQGTTPHITVNMTVVSSDPPSFRRSLNQNIADAHRAAMLAARRGS